MEIFSIVGAMIFGLIAILTLLVTLGLPLGEFTMGEWAANIKFFLLRCVLLVEVHLFFN